MRLDIRSTYLLGCVVLILVIVGFAYLRIALLDVIPCPLCMFQFLCLFFACLFLIVLTWFYPSESVHAVTSLSTITLCVVGMVLSVRHYMLTKILVASPFCFETVAAVRDSFLPSRFATTLSQAFGSGICQGGRVLFGVNISVILLTCFVSILVFMLFQRYRIKHHGMLG